jgi:hypothetical protein
MMLRVRRSGYRYVQTRGHSAAMNGQFTEFPLRTHAQAAKILPSFHVESWFDFRITRRLGLGGLRDSRRV